MSGQDDYTSEIAKLQAYGALYQSRFARGMVVVYKDAIRRGLETSSASNRYGKCSVSCKIHLPVVTIRGITIKGMYLEIVVDNEVYECEWSTIYQESWATNEMPHPHNVDLYKEAPSYVCVGGGIKHLIRSVPKLVIPTAIQAISTHTPSNSPFDWHNIVYEKTGMFPKGVTT